MAPRRKRITTRLVLDVVMVRVRHYESSPIGKIPAEDVYEYEIVNRADLEHQIAQYMTASVEYNEHITTTNTRPGGGPVLLFPETYRKPRE